MAAVVGAIMNRSLVIFPSSFLLENKNLPMSYPPSFDQFHYSHLLVKNTMSENKPMVQCYFQSRIPIEWVIRGYISFRVVDHERVEVSILVWSYRKHPKVVPRWNIDWPRDLMGLGVVALVKKMPAVTAVMALWVLGWLSWFVAMTMPILFAWKENVVVDCAIWRQSSPFQHRAYWVPWTRSKNCCWYRWWYW